MALPESSYIVSHDEVKEFQADVERQTIFLNNEIDRLKPYKSLQDVGSLIALISVFIAIFELNKDILLNYWISSILLFIIIRKSTDYFEFFKLTKPKIADITFQSSRQLAISELLMVRAAIMDLKYNDIAFCIMWVIGLIIATINYFNSQIDLNFVILFCLITLLSAFLIYNNEEMYNFILWLITKVITPSSILDLAKSKDINKIATNFNFSEFHNIKKNQIIFMIIFFVREILILVAICLIFLTYLNNINFNVLKYIFILGIFQIFTYVVLSSFLSFKKIEEVLERQKSMVNRAATFLERQKQSITHQEINSAKNYLKLSRLFLGYKQNFAIFFTWVKIQPNGELNTEENYDLLYQELDIPLEKNISEQYE